MSMPTAEELVESRAAIRDTLPGTCTIISISSADDGMGGTIETEVESPPIPCRVATLSGKEYIMASRITPVPSVSVRMPWGTTVAPDNKIHRGTHVYSVTYVETSDFGLLTSAWCTEDL